MHVTQAALLPTVRQKSCLQPSAAAQCRELWGHRCVEKGQGHIGIHTSCPGSLLVADWCVVGAHWQLSINLHLGSSVEAPNTQHLQQ
jgi:hypothetical protein